MRHVKGEIIPDTLLSFGYTGRQGINGRFHTSVPEENVVGRCDRQCAGMV
jgi:hypothetical protein